VNGALYQFGVVGAELAGNGINAPK
jgi:hypothetical protein